MSGYVMPEEIVKAGNLALKFARHAFPYISKAFAISHNNRIEAKFNDVSVMADCVGGRMIVTIKKDIFYSISFVAADENPFGRFHDPSVSGCCGEIKELSSMVDQAVEGIRRAEQDGVKAFIEQHVLANALA
ncbi:MAG TPA: hypothetical protein PKI93_04970 [Alphaproteobacteria bacterium]|nr:hypothetical protein [Alphaproteobacteria bacterium]HNS45026.1 hypothetical protein [Alphaproteobacteria bacterium]